MKIKNFAGVNQQKDTLDSNLAVSILNFLNSVDLDSDNKRIDELFSDFEQHIKEIGTNPHKVRIHVNLNAFIETIYDLYKNIEEIDHLSYSEFKSTIKSSCQILWKLQNYNIYKANVSMLTGQSLPEGAGLDIVKKPTDRTTTTIDTNYPTFIIDSPYTGDLFMTTTSLKYINDGLLYSSSTSSMKGSEYPNVCYSPPLTLSMNNFSAIINIDDNFKMLGKDDDSIDITIGFANTFECWFSYTNPLSVSRIADFSRLFGYGKEVPVLFLYNRLEFVINKKHGLNPDTTTLCVRVRKSKTTYITENGSGKIIDSPAVLSMTQNPLIEGIPTTVGGEDSSTQSFELPDNIHRIGIISESYNSKTIITLLMVDKNETIRPYQIVYEELLDRNILALNHPTRFYTYRNNGSDQDVFIKTRGHTPKEPSLFISSVRLYDTVLTVNDLSKMLVSLL